jgi:chaperonin cofactor prefoldin
MVKLSINSVWLKEQLSSVNKALDSIRSIRPSQTVWYRSGNALSNASWVLAW